MTPFSFVRADDTAAAIRLGGVPTAKYLGGGTNLVDLMRETIDQPGSLASRAHHEASILV
jgi:xanthine dehydrogenase YagS FAD-binding subunit